MCQRVVVIVVYETKAQSYGKKKMLEFREWSHVRRSNTCTTAHGGLWGYQLYTIHVCSPAVLQDVSQDLMFPRGLTWAHCSGPGPGFGSVQHADSAHTEQTITAAATTRQGRNHWATQQIIFINNSNNIIINIFIINNKSLFVVPVNTGKWTD